MESNILKIVVSLGVPGLALWVFFLLFRSFRWRFPPVPTKWVGPVIVIFMALTATVIFYALTLWAPNHPSPEPSDFIAPIVRIESFPKNKADLTSGDKGVINGSIEGLSNPYRYQIVVYAYTNMWYVQPTGDEPFTEIMSDGTWKNWTHLGTHYVALLVKPPYIPVRQAEAPPSTGGAVIAKSEWGSR
jgi:hypothetical protein